MQYAILKFKLNIDCCLLLIAYCLLLVYGDRIPII